MIVGTITVKKIDYEACFASVFPKMIRKMQNMKDSGLVIRFLQKMGDNSAPILTDILSGMKQEDKNALLVWAGDLLEDRVCATLNDTLAGHDVGKAVKIGSIDIRAAETGCGITMIARDVDLDYKTLVGAVGGGAGSLLSAVVGILPAKAEEQGCRLLNLPAVNEKFRGLIADWLKKNGLVMSVEEIVISPAADEPQQNAGKPAGKPEIPDELEDCLLDAVVKYLKDTRKTAAGSAKPSGSAGSSAKPPKTEKPALI